MQVITTRSELAAWPHDRMRAVVMTMGALHDGHAALMDAARSIVGPEGDVVVTVFVNPLQFGAGEDFDAYPRPREADERVCADHGVDVLFMPDVTEMYGSGGQHITIDPGDLGDILEGEFRPGHFSGMLTVVAKLLFLTQADIALFGEKDYQQLVCIRRMVDELAFPTQIVGVPTVREPDGLAMSSRNVYLDAEDRRRAARIPLALDAARAGLVDGIDHALAAARRVLDEDADIEVEYLTVRALDLGDAKPGPVRILIAARLGSTRLIDNVEGHLP